MWSICVWLCCLCDFKIKKIRFYWMFQMQIAKIALKSLKNSLLCWRTFARKTFSKNGVSRQWVKRHTQYTLFACLFQCIVCIIRAKHWHQLCMCECEWFRLTVCIRLVFAFHGSYCMDNPSVGLFSIYNHTLTLVLTVFCHRTKTMNNNKHHLRKQSY